jgi:hypothetical protein
MPRLSADQWETVRAEREAGVSFPEIAPGHPEVCQDRGLG